MSAPLRLKSACQRLGRLTWHRWPKKKGPKAPKNLALRLFAVSAVAVVAIRRQNHQASVDRERF
jgi:hypothetical protein